MAELSFKIRGMDCAEEVALIKEALRSRVDESRLGFDLINGKLRVDTAGTELTPSDITDAIRKTGLTAIPWDEYSTTGGPPESFWQRHGRGIMTTVSGCAIVVATAYHTSVHGFSDAIGGHGEGHTYPTAATVLYLLAVVTGAWFVLPKAVFALKRLRPDMNLLMVIAEFGAIGLGEWMEAAVVAFLFSVALLLESWSVGRARNAIRALMDLAPLTARCKCASDGCISERPVEEVAVGTAVIVQAGEKIPLDGTILTGETDIDESSITGESVPAEKAPGDLVFAGTINQTGTIEFEVTRAANDTTLAGIIHMIEEAQSRRAPSEQWVERFARYYTPAMMLVAIGFAALPPLWGQPWNDALYRALVVLVIACPCALVISTPVSVVAGLARAARAGILIKGGVFLEMPAKLRAIAFDKTGTITRGKPVVREIVPLNGHDQAELLTRAASLQAQSEHPLADAILHEAETQRIAYEPAAAYRSIHGRGAEAEFEGRPFWIGSHRLLHERGLETPDCHDKAVALEDRGHSIVAIGNESHVCGLISLTDEIRECSSHAIQSLRSLGIEHIVMLTGDNEHTAAAVASQVGIDETLAGLLPDEKVETVRKLVDKYGSVAMVGDGVNDAPALAASSLGIAMGVAGSDAAIETADIALMSDDLSKLPWLINHSKRTLRVIKQNIAFALGLKLVFILLASVGLATLWMAIAADMGASLLVIFNGLRLLR